MLISVDEDRYGQHARTVLNELETEIYTQACTKEQFACELIKNGKKNEALADLQKFTETCAENVMSKVKLLANAISADIQSVGGLYGPRKEFLEAYAKRTNLEI
jgi:hypothetical protein